MTPHHHGTHPDSASAFDGLMAEVMATADRFGHREHVHLTWLAVRRHGVPTAIGLVSDGIQRTARYAGAPQKYHATVSRAWVELVGHHAAERAEGSFTEFVDHHPALLDKRLLTRFYRSATLASPQAKSSWVEPDLVPFPWQNTDCRNAKGNRRSGEDDEGTAPDMQTHLRAAEIHVDWCRRHWLRLSGRADAERMTNNSGQGFVLDHQDPQPSIVTLGGISSTLTTSETAAKSGTDSNGLWPGSLDR